MHPQSTGVTGRSGCTPAEPYPPSRELTLFIDSKLTNHIPAIRGSNPPGLKLWPVNALKNPVNQIRTKSESKANQNRTAFANQQLKVKQKRNKNEMNTERFR